MYDDDEYTQIEEDQATVFDPNPWGARQRVLPRATFVPAPRGAPPPPPMRVPASTPPMPMASMPVMMLGPMAMGTGMAMGAAMPAVSPMPFVAMPRPRFPEMPRVRRWARVSSVLMSRYAAPIYLAVIVLSLGLAYLTKPSTHTSAHASSSHAKAGAVAVAAAMTDVRPVASAAIVSVIEPTTPTVEPIEFVEPAVAPAIAPAIAPKAAVDSKRARGIDSKRVAVVKSKAVKHRAPIKIDTADTSSPLGRMRPSH